MNIDFQLSQNIVTKLLIKSYNNYYLIFQLFKTG